MWAEKSTRAGSRGRNETLGVESPPFIHDELLFCSYIWTQCCAVVFSYLTGTILLMRGLFTYSRLCNCKGKRKKRLHFLQNYFICLKTKLFLTRNLNFAFLWEYASNVIS